MNHGYRSPNMQKSSGAGPRSLLKLALFRNGLKPWIYNKTGWRIARWPPLIFSHGGRHIGDMCSCVLHEDLSRPGPRRTVRSALTNQRAGGVERSRDQVDFC